MPSPFQNQTVVYNEAFHRERVVDCHVSLKCNDCMASKCEFINITTGGNVWGGNNHWEDCLFDHAVFQRPISPGNTFDGCRFVDSKFIRYHPYSTLFRNCQFVRCHFDAMKITNWGGRVRRADLVPFQNQLVFAQSHFESVSFERCNMRGTTFAECTFQDVITPLSDFEEYVDSNVKFWQPFDLNEARLAFLRDYVETVREAVGTESMSYEILEGCRRRFATGNAAWTQEMRKLIEDVPYEEYEASSAGSLEIFYKYPVLE